MWTPKDYINSGDCESAVVDILANLTPGLDDYEPLTISTSLVGYAREYRWVEVVQTGDIFKSPKISRTRMDVDVRCPGDPDIAKDIASIAKSSILRYQGGVYAGYGLKIVKVGLEQGVTRVPEKYQEVTRYLFSVRVTTVPFGDTPAPPC